MEKDKNTDETLLQEIRNRVPLKMPTPDAIRIRVSSLPKRDEHDNKE